MGLKVVPENILRRMEREARAALGKAGRTMDECVAVASARNEKALQLDMVRLMDQRGIFFSRSRMDKKTTTRKGLFDFTVYLPNGRYLAVEAKVRPNTLSADQEKVFNDFWQKTQRVVWVIHTLQEFRQLLDDNT